MLPLYNNVLSRPLTVKNLTLRNRIVRAPMTRTMSPGGIPSQQSADYYRRRAEGQVGLILSEGTVIDRPASQNAPDVPHYLSYVKNDLAPGKAFA
jgi:2,4-dienoyl-CoA reductase-like NADH-dependent reductase (Old Yellow Enzyme family)